jgi:hypothetical protein
VLSDVRRRMNSGLFPKLLCLASAEKFERGFDPFGFADVSVGEELVDLEPTEFLASHVAGGTPSVPCR